MYPIEKSLKGMLWLTLTSFFLLSCHRSQTQPSEPVVAAESFTCEPGAKQEPNQLDRLSRFELENSLEDLFGSEILEAGRSLSDPLPPDNLVLDFDTIDGAVFSEHVAALNSLATNIAEVAVATDDRLRKLAGECAISPPVTDQCVENFIRTFGRRAFRSSMPNGRVSEIRNRFWNGMQEFDERERWQILISYFIQAPEFIFKVEGGTVSDPVDPERLKLSNYELVSRLAFLLWGRLPDVELLDSAESGEVATDAGLSKQVERMLDAPAAAKNFSHFARLWLRLDEIPNTRVIENFQANPNVRTVFQDRTLFIRSGAINEVLALVNYMTFVVKGTYADLMTTDLAMPDNEYFSGVYGIDVWNGKFGAADLIHLTDSDRKGLLSHAAFLLEENEKSRPVLRGAFIRRKILCDDIPPPNPSDFPPDALTFPSPLATDSTRTTFEKKTDSQTCMNCHALLNPLGFAYEKYDTLGRLQADNRERLFDADGVQIGAPAIDTHVNAVLKFPETISVSGPEQLNKAIATSAKGSMCMALKWFRYTQGRQERRSDGCMLKQIHLALVKPGGGIKEMIRETTKLQILKYYKPSK